MNFASTAWGTACALNLDCTHGGTRPFSLAPWCNCVNGWGGLCCLYYEGDMTCSKDSSLCPEKYFTAAKFPISDLLDDEGKYQGPLRIATADMVPENFQGIFWLSDQGENSSMLTMAETRDGDGLSKWNQGAEEQMRIRISGDRTWATASHGELMSAATFFDAVYHFSGTPVDDPTDFQIRMSQYNLAFDMTKGPLKTLVDGKLNYKMTLVPKDSEAHIYPPTDDDNGRPQAVIWRRHSYVDGKEAKDAEYFLTQIVDGEGNPTNAFDAYLEYNRPSETDTSKEFWKDGYIYYRTLDTDEGVDKIDKIPFKFPKVI